MPHAEQRRDASARGQLAGAHGRRCSKALEDNAWDGAWYRRAYFDDGFALGLGLKPRMPHRFDRPVLERDLRRRAPDRARQAMEAVDNYLVRTEDGLMTLFSAALRGQHPRPRLHQGLSGGHAREWRPIHPWRAVEHRGVHHAGRRRPGRRAVLHAQSRSTMRARAPRPNAIGWNPM